MSPSAAQTPLVAGAIPGRAFITPPCLGPLAKATMNSLSTAEWSMRAMAQYQLRPFPSDARSRPEHRSQRIDRNALRFGTQSAKRLLEWRDHPHRAGPGMDRSDRHRHPLRAGICRLQLSADRQLRASQGGQCLLPHRHLQRTGRGRRMVSIVQWAALRKDAFQRQPRKP